MLRPPGDGEYQWCAEITAPAGPSDEETASLVRCAKESITASDELWLVEKLSTRRGAPRKHLGINELMTMPDADTAKPVYPLRGAWTRVV